MAAAGSASAPQSAPFYERSKVRIRYDWERPVRPDLGQPPPYAAQRDAEGQPVRYGAHSHVPKKIHRVTEGLTDFQDDLMYAATKLGKPLKDADGKPTDNHLVRASAKDLAKALSAKRKKPVSEDRVRDNLRELVVKQFFVPWEEASSQPHERAPKESVLGRRRGEGNCTKTCYVIRSYNGVRAAWLANPNIAKSRVGAAQHFWVYGNGKRLLTPGETDDSDLGWKTADYLTWRASHKEREAEPELVSKPRGWQPEAGVPPTPTRPTPAAGEEELATSQVDELREAIRKCTAARLIDERAIQDTWKAAREENATYDELVAVLGRMRLDNLKTRNAIGVVTIIRAKIRAYRNWRAQHPEVAGDDEDIAWIRQKFGDAAAEEEKRRLAERKDSS